MKELKVFSYEQKDIRMVAIDGMPWMVAKDVCDVLDISNTAQAADRLDESERLISTIHISGQGRDTLLVNESGLYSLIFSSRKPEAKAFKKWVTSVVLPTIRETGSFVSVDPALSDIDKSEKAASIFINLVHPCESGKILIAHNVCKKHGLPVDVLPAYAEEKKTSSLSDLLKKFNAGLSAQAANRKLVEKGILEHCKRKSSKGEKMFLSITKNGEAFGKNLVSPQNPRETQPHWYEDKFPDLLKMIA